MIKNNYPALAGFIFVLISTIFILSQAARQTFILPSSQNSPSLLPSSTFPTPAQSSSSAVLGVRIKRTNCQIQNSLPDPQCTPGAIEEGVTTAQICTPGYSSKVRNVSIQTKDEVYREYTLPIRHSPGEFEVDHLISLELGGSNDIANLWPQAALPQPGYHQKDSFENYLHQQVCSGNISLSQAQQEISQNWLQYWIQDGRP